MNDEKDPPCIVLCKLHILAKVGHVDFHLCYIGYLHTMHSIHITYGRNRKSGSTVVCFFRTKSDGMKIRYEGLCDMKPRGQKWILIYRNRQTSNLIRGL